MAASATGDEGARGRLRGHSDIVVAVDCTDAGAADDLDAPQDLAALAAAEGAP